MKIICTATFLDGTDRFEAGETRVVDDARAAYFIAQKWAHESTQAHGAQPAAAGDAAAVTLTVQNGQHGQEATHG